jgi:hypothetical protein
MAEFAQYAIAATEEALLDSGCLPLSSSQKERTVSYNLFLLPNHLVNATRRRASPSARV